MQPNSSEMLPALYLAGPLFSEAEKSFNMALRDLLSSRFNVYLPQEDGSLLVDLMREGVPLGRAELMIFKSDIEAISECKYFVIILDGRTVDEGAAFELGVAYTMGKICVGIQTDPRRLLPIGNNPMITMPLIHVAESANDLMVYLCETESSSEGLSMLPDLERLTIQ